jgi:predicted transcriptional regulator
MFNLIAAAVVFATCNVAEISKGATEADVRAVCGAPSAIAKIGQIDKWIYVNPNNTGYDIIWFASHAVRNAVHTVPDAAL